LWFGLQEQEPSASSQANESFGTHTENIITQLSQLQCLISISMSTSDHTLQIARGLAAQGHLDAALSLLQPLGQVPQPDPRVLNLLGSVQLQVGRIDDAIRTLERAAPLSEGSGIPYINLGHALRKAQRFTEAVAAFKAGTRLSPREPEGFVGLGEALLESYQFALAHQAFTESMPLMSENALQRERAQAGHFATAPFWWQSHRYGPIELRPITLEDVPFFAECSADRAFMDHFNVQQTSSIDRGELASRIAQEARLTPVQRGNIRWVVWHTAANQRIGLAGIPSFHLLNQKAEVAVGVRGANASSGTGIATFLAVLDFAFERLGIHKAQALVYHTNPNALKQLIALGFDQEGLLNDEILLPDGRWLHVHSMALFQSRWSTLPRLLALRKHFRQPLPAEA
jgi:RimJ/RimL family protein N-acetyltransferase